VVRRVRVRGIVERSGAGFAQSRRPDGKWDLWRVVVRLRPWCAQGGAIETSSLALSRRTRLPHLLWQLAFLKNSIVEVLVELDDTGAPRGRLVAYLGPRRDRSLRNAHSGWLGDRRLEDPFFGRFTFDERLDWFATKCAWLGHPVSLALGMLTDGSTDLASARRVFADPAQWDARARVIAADELLEVKKEHWLDTDDEPLSRDDVMARMTLESISVHPGPFIQFFFGDGDLFSGHTIIVTFDEEEGQTWAELAG